MRDADYFANLLSRAPTRELQATLVRRVPMLAMTKAPSVDFLFTSGKANRFNSRGVSCVYFAEDEPTATAEYERHSMGQRQPFVTYFADVHLQYVIDLFSSQTLSALRMTARDLRTPWVGARKPTPAQCLGEAMSRQDAVAAVRFPSEAARLKGFSGANIVIFRDCVRRPDHVHILGPTKKPLQKWP
ncbi:MAG: RES family NAD+ phosphorylase [Verrucomicrobiales bacterium]|nr:RES family NAD+ phosphorylase [Verrucomicrobiales bacterium]